MTFDPWGHRRREFAALPDPAQALVREWWYRYRVVLRRQAWSFYPPPPEWATFLAADAACAAAGVPRPGRPMPVPPDICLEDYEPRG